MASSAGNSGKKLIQIDISSDSVCPWCFVGKKNLDKAIASTQDKYDFKLKWHPFFLDRSAPKEGVNKKEFFRKKFGSRYDQIVTRMTEVFKGLGLVYDLDGLTGSSWESHRLLWFAGQQGDDKQHKLAEALFNGYFVEGKFIGDKEFLVASAAKVGVEGAAEFLANPNNGAKEVEEDFQKFSSDISGVPHYLINGKYTLSGGQGSESFLRAFQIATGT
ncbi:OLC1v1009819C1 [Oldenlandia corymbosa var. corymbosa]|uniref:OLC1v1009819C1 n=1 Tax=Oldenlandia corymbosa var. corymbosa TaxID=529605 RepID=A0AAV1DPW2_OLDCO|nr:OLC1v1009819C1 [Oldenlandia corymbosa var. corymbosa]